jgi:hypothetical protein
MAHKLKPMDNIEAYKRGLGAGLILGFALGLIIAVVL